MRKTIQLCLVVLVLSVSVGHAVAADRASKTSKPYRLINLNKVVSNSDACKADYYDVKDFTKQDVQLNLANSGASRRVTGTLEYNHQKLDYVVAVPASAESDKIPLLYPAILSTQNARCYYTALAKPSEAVAATPKKAKEPKKAAKNKKR